MHDELPPLTETQMVCGAYPSVQKPFGVALTACAVQVQTISEKEFYDGLRDPKVTKNTVRAE